MAMWDGHLEEAVAMRRQMLARGEELSYIDYAAQWAVYILRARVHLGDSTRALEAVLEGSKGMPRNVGSDGIILFCLAHLGRHGEVRGMLERLVVTRPDFGSAEDETDACVDTTSLEAAVLSGHRQATELLLRRLADSTSRTTGVWFPVCAGRYLGAAAALLDRPDEARGYYQKAIEDCTEMRFRPELALTRLQLAELLLEHYPKERAEALEHLDFAIKEFQDMKMQPSLERALRHKGILRA
jgi:tetratricopeptide (TPR) repeat protein